MITTAYAQQAGAQAASPMSSIIMMIALFAIMYFLMIRPQQKRMKEHRQLISALKKGDEVITNSGLMGKIIALDEHAVDLEIAKNVTVRIQRPFVSGILPKGTLKAELKENTKGSASEEKTEKAPEKTEEEKSE